MNVFEVIFTHRLGVFFGPIRLFLPLLLDAGFFFPSGGGGASVAFMAPAIYDDMPEVEIKRLKG
jgi:hypothetical protein